MEEGSCYERNTADTLYLMFWTVDDSSLYKKICKVLSYI